MPNQIACQSEPSRTTAGEGTPLWKIHVAQAIRDPAELCSLLDLPPELADEARTAMGNFPLLLPRPMLSRIKPGNPADPVLRQFLPTLPETAAVPGFSTDPLQEQSACPLPGVLAKYEGRILILATRACPVHCRYCFRRYFPDTQATSSLGETGSRKLPNNPQDVEGSPPTSDGYITSICRYVQSRPDCREVILSGGEPLLLDDEQLGNWFSLLSQIAHIQRVRIHTRLPVVIPQRVTPQLIALFRGAPFQSVVVFHINHPQEIDDAVAEAITRLGQSGAILLCQSVLLKGVNDDPDVLATLYERIAGLRVLPYYLHQLDRVLGAHHFEVPVDRGKKIIEELRKRLPGYLVPRYVREEPGKDAKVPL